MAAITPLVTSVLAGGMRRDWYATNAFALSLRLGKRYYIHGWICLRRQLLTKTFCLFYSFYYVLLTYLHREKNNDGNSRKNIRMEYYEDESETE